VTLTQAGTDDLAAGSITDLANFANDGVINYAYIPGSPVELAAIQFAATGDPIGTWFKCSVKNVDETQGTIYFVELRRYPGPNPGQNQGYNESTFVDSVRLDLGPLTIDHAYSAYSDWPTAGTWTYKLWLRENTPQAAAEATYRRLVLLEIKDH
jgi:hypothetical protein